MGRTWKDDPAQRELELGSILECLNQQLLVGFELVKERFTDLRVNVDIHEASEELRLHRGRWTGSYFPRCGGLTLRMRDKKTKQNRILFSNYNAQTRTLKTGRSRKASISKFFDEFLSHAKIQYGGSIIYYDDKRHVSESVNEIAPIILDINHEIIRYLARNPHKIHDLSSRKFEELVTDFLRDFGFDVELTRATRDGGKDIIAYIQTQVTAFLTYVECKKYAPHHKVGVDVVREVYGVQRIYRANKSLIVTTSSFTKDAIEERRHIETEMDLRDFEDLKAWLNNCARSP